MEETTEKSSGEVLGNECLEFMEHLRERYGDDFQIGETMLIAEVLVEVGDRDEVSCVEYAASDPRRFVQIGFLRAALRGAERSLESDDILSLGDEEDEV